MLTSYAVYSRDSHVLTPSFPTRLSPDSDAAVDPVGERRHFEALRREYEAMALDVDDLDPEPMRQLRTWLDEGADVAPNEPGAVILATAAEGCGASARNVLLRGIDDRGLPFFTSHDSRQGREPAGDHQSQNGG